MKAPKLFRSTNHSMKRRCACHNDRQKGMYMFTLVMDGRAPLLGELQGYADAPPNTADAPHVRWSELGKTIAEDEVANGVGCW